MACSSSEHDACVGSEHCWPPLQNLSRGLTKTGEADGPFAKEDDESVAVVVLVEQRWRDIARTKASAARIIVRIIGCHASLIDCIHLFGARAMAVNASGSPAVREAFSQAAKVVPSKLGRKLLHARAEGDLTWRRDLQPTTNVRRRALES
eukprot:scaffold294180_cov27-Tisochrysis_lutea.AAC.1